MPYYRKLPSGRWQATVRHPNGQRFTKTDALKKVVVAWAVDLEHQHQRGIFIDPNAGRITVGEWWEEWRAAQSVEVATRRKRESLWRTHVEKRWASWPLESITSIDIERWVVDLRTANVGREAAASAFRLLGHLLSDAARHQRIRANPCAVVDGPSSPRHIDRFLDVEEAERLLQAITKVGDRTGLPRSMKAPRVPDPVNRLFVRTMLDAGLRWEESAGLHGFRVDLRRQVLRVQEVVRRDRTIKPIPKSSAGQREVPLTDSLAAAYEEHLVGVSREGLVFPDPRGGVLDYSNWRKRTWLPAVEAANLGKPLPTPHDCRHSYGTWLAEHGVPPHEIAALMGHGSLRAVEKYIHATSRRMERARKALDARVTHGGGLRAQENPAT